MIIAKFLERFSPISTRASSQGEATNIVVISDSNFYKNTERLIISINKICKNKILLFCDYKETFEPLSTAYNVELVELEDMVKLGVKRVKFDAYYRAICRGDFLYLDADIIVLEDLGELLYNAEFTACHDDYTVRSSHVDAKYPWKNRSLENKYYINSGVFFAPKKLKNFFYDMYIDSLDDSIWELYIMPPYLYDNHFLCAYINLKSIDVNYVDGFEYNWQGIYEIESLQRIDNSIWNTNKNIMLKLVHFAGISNIGEFLLELPVDVSSVFLEKVNSNDDLKPNVITTNVPGKMRRSNTFSLDVALCVDDPNVRFVINNHDNVYISYHWYNEDMTAYRWDNNREKIIPTFSGNMFLSIVNVLAPFETGTYYLKMDLVEEGKQWFCDTGLLSTEYICVDIY